MVGGLVGRPGEGLVRRRRGKGEKGRTYEAGYEAHDARSFRRLISFGV